MTTLEKNQSRTQYAEHKRLIIHADELLTFSKSACAISLSGYHHSLIDS